MCRCDSGRDRPENQRQHEGEAHNAGLDGRGALDALEPEGDVVDDDHHDAADA